MAAKAEDGIDYRPKRWAQGLAAALLAIGIGAVLGAWLRWGLGLWLNPWFAAVRRGILAANLAGGYLVGAAMTMFHINVDLSPELRPFSPPVSLAP